MSLTAPDTSCIFGFDSLTDDSHYKNRFTVTLETPSILQYGKHIPDEEERLRHKECPVYVSQRTGNNWNPTNYITIIELVKPYLNQ